MTRSDAQTVASLDGSGGSTHKITIRVSPPPVRNYTNKSKTKLPANACDTHIHVVGPQQRFAVIPSKIGPFEDIAYEDSTIDDALAMLGACGMDRAIVVGTTLYGRRYEPMVHALTRAPDRMRGVTILDPESTDGELSLLDRAGVVGIRLSHADGPTLDMRTIGRALDLDWTIECVTHDWSHWRDQLLAVKGRIVIEHMGHLDPRGGFDAPTFRFLLEALDRGNVWVKLSARASRDFDLPFQDILPYARKLVEHAPERILYGSDWPHLLYFDRPMVDDVDLLDLMLAWAPDEATRNRIMVDNPAHAYRWP